MSEYLPFIVIGLVTGSVYGLAATGLVLTFRTTGVFNFAQGAMGALCAYVFYFLHVSHDMPWVPALVLSVIVLGVILGVLAETVTRTLAHVSAAYQVATTVGMIVFVIALCTQWYGTNGAVYPTFLPTKEVEIGSVFVGYDQFIIAGVGMLLCVSLFACLRWTRIGIALRAVVDSPELLAMTGTSPTRVRQIAWVISTVFAGLAGVLIAPSFTLDSVGLSLLIVQAFGAAAIGYFSNLPLTYVGGLVVGVLAAVSTQALATTPSLAGVPPSMPFIVLIVALLVLPRARLARQRLVALLPLAQSWEAPRPARLVSYALFGLLLLLVPLFAGNQQPGYIDFVCYAILFLSLGLLVRTSGQVSLGHMAFAAIGGAASAHMTHDWGLPWVPAVLLAGLVAVPVGALIAIPAIRLSGIYLALATLGFGVLAEYLLYPATFMFGMTQQGVVAERPSGLTGDVPYYYVALAALGITVGATMLIQKSRPGRLLRALSDSPRALEAHGASVNLTRLMVFCISAFFASISGALLVSGYGVAVGSYFSINQSLTVFVVLIITLVGFPWYALAAAAGLTLVPAYVTWSGTTNYLQMFFGLTAIMIPVIAARYPGAPQWVRDPIVRWSERRDAASAPEPTLSSESLS